MASYTFLSAIITECSPHQLKRSLNKLGNVVGEFTRRENMKSFNTATKIVSTRHDIARRYGCASDAKLGGQLFEQKNATPAFEFS